MAQPPKSAKRFLDFEEVTPSHSSHKYLHLEKRLTPFSSPISKEGRAVALPLSKGRAIDFSKQQHTSKTISQLYGIHQTLAPREQTQAIIAELLILESSLYTANSVHPSLTQKVRTYFQVLFLKGDLSDIKLMAEIGAARFFLPVIIYMHFTLIRPISRFELVKSPQRFYL